MSFFSAGTEKQNQENQDSEALTRVRSELESRYATGGPGAVAPVTRMLDLLNPHGLWRFNPDTPAAAAPGGLPPLPAGADPLTGCRSVDPST